jgi:hypothetical protein
MLSMDIWAMLQRNCERGFVCLAKYGHFAACTGEHKSEPDLHKNTSTF